MTAFPRWGKVERELPRRKTSLAACGRRHTRRHNDTPALNTLKVLRGALDVLQINDIEANVFTDMAQRFDFGSVD